MPGLVAVTGASGFVGARLADALLRRGRPVRALVRAARAGEALRARGVDVVRGDLTDVAVLPALVDGAPTVVHVAGLVAARDEAAFHRVNAGATARLAAAARAAGAARFVHVSSLAVTGPTEHGRPVDETTTPRPVTPYGRSKQAGEEAVRAAGVPFTIVRPPAVYGPGDRQFLRLFRAARLGVAVTLGDGSQELSLVHVDDLADALCAVAESEAAAGRTYHAAHPEVVTQRGLAVAVGTAVGRPARVIGLPVPIVRAALWASGTAARIAGATSVLSPDKAPELLAPAWTCSSDAIARDTGWRARFGLAQGLADTARWYREAGWL